MSHLKVYLGENSDFYQLVHPNGYPISHRTESDSVVGGPVKSQFNQLFVNKTALLLHQYLNGSYLTEIKDNNSGFKKITALCAKVLYAHTWASAQSGIQIQKLTVIGKEEGSGLIHKDNSEHINYENSWTDNLISLKFEDVLKHLSHCLHIKFFKWIDLSSDFGFRKEVFKDSCDDSDIQGILFFSSQDAMLKKASSNKDEKTVQELIVLGENITSLPQINFDTRDIETFFQKILSKHLGIEANEIDLSWSTNSLFKEVIHSKDSLISGFYSVNGAAKEFKITRTKLAESVVDQLIQNNEFVRLFWDALTSSSFIGKNSPVHHIGVITELDNTEMLSDIMELLVKNTCNQLSDLRKENKIDGGDPKHLDHKSKKADTKEFNFHIADVKKFLSHLDDSQMDEASSLFRTGHVIEAAYVCGHPKVMTAISSHETLIEHKKSIICGVGNHFDEMRPTRLPINDVQEGEVSIYLSFNRENPQKVSLPWTDKKNAPDFLNVIMAPCEQFYCLCIWEVGKKYGYRIDLRGLEKSWLNSHILNKEKHAEFIFSLNQMVESSQNNIAAYREKGLMNSGRPETFLDFTQATKQSNSGKN